MTPIPPIPEDLQESYAYLKTGTMTTKANKLVHYWSDERICGLIERIAKLTAANEEADKLIVDTVDTLTIWTKQGFATPEGYTPMWNPTLRRLRNYLASRATRTPPQEGQ